MRRVLAYCGAAICVGSIVIVVTKMLVYALIVVAVLLILLILYDNAIIKKTDS